MTRLDYNQVVKIKVFGVGGGGCNAVNRMVNDGVKGAEFYVVNSDIQCLNVSACKNRVVIGKELCKGQGCGADPERGQKAAIESSEEIKKLIQGTDMVFITAGMGGGTGTGAAPVFAKIAKESGALTVAIVTTPFDFEGTKRSNQAKIGLEKLKEYCDSLIVVSNNKLLSVIGKIPLMDSFKEADNVLRQGVQTITDLIAVPAFINLDFADIETVMKGKGTALIGIGMAKGEDKAKVAAQHAIESPLLDAQIKGAKSAIVNITGGANVSIYDSSVAVDYIREAAGGNIDIIYGVAINEQLDDNIIVTVIATGFELNSPNVQVKPQINPVYFQNEQEPETKVEEEPAVERNETVVKEKEQDGIPSFFKSRF